MKHLLALSAFIETGAALALLVFPSAAVSLMFGVPLESPIAMTIGRVAAVALLAISVVCWIARGDAGGRAARGVVAGMLVYNAGISAVLVLAATGAGLRGVGLWLAVVLHAVLSGWCVWSLVKGRMPRRLASGRG